MISIGVEFCIVSYDSLFSHRPEPLHIKSCWLPAGPQVVEFTLCLSDCANCVYCCGAHLETTTEYS